MAAASGGGSGRGTRLEDLIRLAQPVPGPVVAGVDIQRAPAETVHVWGSGCNVQRLQVSACASRMRDARIACSLEHHSMLT
jgi:hypothetical protein